MVTRENTIILRRRQMTAVAFWIAGKSSFCFTVWWDWQQRHIEGPRNCPVVRRIHRWMVDSPHKGSVTVADGFTTRRYSNVENISIWWRHDESLIGLTGFYTEKNRQFDNSVVTGGTVSCHYDNLGRHQWWQSCQSTSSWHVHIHPCLLISFCSFGYKMLFE